MGELAVVAHDFTTSLAFVLSAEGGLSNVSGDRGGVTNFGITQTTYTAWLESKGLPDLPVADISHEYVEAIYHDNYWKPAGCDALVSPLNLVHFDACVQHGQGNAGAMLLAATFAAGQTPERQSYAYLALRYAFYSRLAAKGPTQAKFLPGWKNRVFNVLREVEL